MKRLESVVVVKHMDPTLIGLEGIVYWIDEFEEIVSVYLPKLSKYKSFSYSNLSSGNFSVGYDFFLGKELEVSSDLVMDDDMELFEGCFRTPDDFWQVLIVSKNHGDFETSIEEAKWENGVTGLKFRLSKQRVLNRETITQLLSDFYKSDDWEWVVGPDSMVLR